jgi:hypothetical protein
MAEPFERVAANLAAYKLRFMVPNRDLHFTAKIREAV